MTFSVLTRCKMMIYMNIYMFENKSISGPYGKTRKKCVGANLYVTKIDPLPFENNQEFSI
jgi:hypothetical protein